MKFEKNNVKILNYTDKKEDKRLDKENLNGIPEEENEQTSAEETAEETETAEEFAEEIAEEASETADQAATEDETDEAEEEIQAKEPAEICPVCGEREVNEDSNYCTECETKMLKRRIPFFAWIAGLISLSFSLFAFMLVLLASAPALQVIKGDSYASKKNWYGAYTAYADVQTMADEINAIIGTESQYTKVGMGVNKRIINAVANYSSPIDAYYVAQNMLTGVNVDELGFIKKYKAVCDEHDATFDQIEETLNKAYDEKPDADAIYAQLDAFKGKEGITNVYIDFYKFAVADLLGSDLDTQIAMLKDLEKECLATGKDYSWLYCQPMAEILCAAGKGEEATKYLDAIIEKDSSKYDAYALKIDVLLDSGDKDAASKILAEFKVNNEETETAYLLEIEYLRRTGEQDKAKTLCLEALELYESIPERSRQLALIYMAKGDYYNAFDSMMLAYNYAYYIYQSTYDTSTLDDPAFYNSLYLSAYLLKNSDQMKEEYAEDIEEILGQFEEEALEDITKEIISGKKTVAEVLTEGECDLA